MDKIFLIFYYFNSFVDISNKRKDKSDNYTKEKFKKEIYEIFRKTKNLLLNTNDIKDEDAFPEITKSLIEIQIFSINTISQFNFNFGNFVTACLNVPMEEENLEYIKNQLEDTLTLLNYSELSKNHYIHFIKLK
jgi:hypothetical protein